jgi:hypothetical protein
VAGRRRCRRLARVFEAILTRATEAAALSAGSLCDGQPQEELLARVDAKAKTAAPGMLPMAANAIPASLIEAVLDVIMDRSQQVLVLGKMADLVKANPGTVPTVIVAAGGHTFTLTDMPKEGVTEETILDENEDEDDEA